MKTQLFDSYTGDHLVLDVNERRTPDGYLVATARVARTGIQLYKGDELGRPDMKVVRVMRPESEVFSADSMKSYARKPITLDHPPEMVGDGNWSKYAKGAIDGEVIRDGQFIRVPMMLNDRKAIDAVSRGVKQLSVGYTMDLEFGEGETDSGEAFDAIMSNIRVNHLAVVPAARGGSELRIGDDDDNKETKMGKKFAVDGVTVEASDEMSAQVIEKALAKDAKTISELTDKVTKLTADAIEAKMVSDAAAVEAKKAIDTKDGEIVVLKKSVEDSKITPAALQKLVKDRSIVIQKAATFLGDKFDFSPHEEIDIMRAAVGKKVTDAVAKDMNVDAIKGAFALMTVDVKITDGVKNLADALSVNSQNHNQNLDDAAALRQKAFDESTEALGNAWKTKAA